MKFKEYRFANCVLFIGVYVLAMGMLAFPLHAQTAKDKVYAPLQNVKVHRVKVPVSNQQMKDVQRVTLLNEIEILSMDIWPESQCQGSWEAVIRNPNVNMAVGNVTVIPSQYRADANKWTEGPAVNFNLGKNQIKIVTGQWLKMIYSSKFKVAFRPENTTKIYAEKVIDLVIPTNMNVSILGVETSNEYVKIMMKNNSSQAICDLNVQTYMAKNSDPNTWTPGGGSSSRILGKETKTHRFTKNGNEWKQGWDLVKIMLGGPPGSGVRYAERILPLH